MAIFGKDKDADHAGSGVDKPDPRTVTERVVAAVKAVISARKDTGNGSCQSVTPDESQS